MLKTAKIIGIPHHRERIYIVGIQGGEINLYFPQIEKRKVTDFLEEDVSSKYYYTDKSKSYALLSEYITNQNTVYQYRRTYVRENKSGECPTLTANMGTGGNNVPLILDPKGIRKLTPRECFNLQGFPASYKLPNISDSQLYKLAGNAVSYPVVKLIVDKLFSLHRI